ncbi:DUF2062 domain-containing protein, partial [Acinetobacter baumannii]
LLKHPRLLDGAYWHDLFIRSWNDVLLPFAIGGLILSVVCAAISYPLTLCFLRARRAARENQT